MFSNIDERNNPPIRRELVTALRAHPRSAAGLWRYSGNRPTVAPEIAEEPILHERHWERLARSKVCFALPGVGGDLTRNHAEILGIGSCLLTVKGDQRWPGNADGCWAEAERSADGLMARLAVLLDDGAERERIARLGRWYYETNLKPGAMARRVVRAVNA